jgi:FkbM family methyltransferase
METMMRGKLEKAFVNFLCCFMPFKHARQNIRRYFAREERRLQEERRLLRGAVLDPDGFGMLEALMWHAGIPEKHKDIMYRIREGDVCIDCGANVGIISDVITRLGGTCYAFEPEPGAAHILKMKFAGKPKFHLLPCAVSHKEGKVAFRSYGTASHICHIVTDAAATVQDIDENAAATFDVEAVRLTTFISRLLMEHERIFILKIDIEGHEYDVLDDLINTELYKKIVHIFVEPHERLFPALAPDAERIRTIIKQRNINNIYLDWV